MYIYMYIRKSLNIGYSSKIQMQYLLFIQGQIMFHYFKWIFPKWHSADFYSGLKKENSDEKKLMPLEGVLLLFSSSVFQMIP